MERGVAASYDRLEEMLATSIVVEGSYEKFIPNP
jgi:hypothetical protein